MPLEQVYVPAEPEKDDSEPEGERTRNLREEPLKDNLRKYDKICLNHLEAYDKSLLVCQERMPRAAAAPSPIGIPSGASASFATKKTVRVWRSSSIGAI